jgi:hypothetical protein
MATLILRSLDRIPIESQFDTAAKVGPAIGSRAHAR